MWSTPEIAAIVGVVVLAACVQGYSGFGFGIVSITLFSLMATPIERLSVLISICALFLCAALAVISRPPQGIAWRRLGLLFLGAAGAVPLGYLFIYRLGDHPVFRVVLGVCLAVFAVTAFMTPRRVFKAWHAVIAGTLGGFLGGAFTTSGPPAVIYLYSQEDDPRDMKATLQSFFLGTTVYRLVVVGFGGGYSWELVRTALLGVALLLPVLFVAHRLSKRGSPERFRRVVYALIGLFGLFMAARATLQWLTLS